MLNGKRNRKSVFKANSTEKKRIQSVLNRKTEQVFEAIQLKDARCILNGKSKQKKRIQSVFD